MPMQQHPAIQLILEEHQALATVIRALRQAVDRARSVDAPPDFEAMRAMLFYLDEVPARVHHVTESELLFPRIRERCPALRPVLDRLEAEHGHEETSVRELELALGVWQVMGDERREAFDLMLHAYAEGYLGHIQVEEDYVLPVAMDYLSMADWRELEDAFARQRGALAGTVSRAHRALYARIVAHPSPS